VPSRGVWSDQWWWVTHLSSTVAPRGGSVVDSAKRLCSLLTGWSVALNFPLKIFRAMWPFVNGWLDVTATLFLWSPYVIRQTIIFLPCGFYLLFFLLSFFLAKSQRSEIGCLPYFQTWCGLSAKLECMCEMCCTRLAENTGCKQIAILAPSHNFVRQYLRSWGMYWQSEKNMLNINTSSTCPHNMVNFGLLTAEIGSGVWGTPANFNGFCVLAALLHDTLVVGVSQTPWRWTEGATHIWQGDHHVGHWPTF